jgi:hypothetical protein
VRGAIAGKPPFKPVESPLVAGRGVDHKARNKKRGNSDVGESMDRVATLAQQSLDRIRVLEADGQLRREHAKKIEHKLDEHARVQLRLEESLQRIYDLLAHGDGGGRRASHRSSRDSRQGSDAGHRSGSVTKSPNSVSERGDASPGPDAERRNSDGRATPRDDSRGRSVRKRVPISTDSQTGAREATEAKAAEQRALSL